MATHEGLENSHNMGGGEKVFLVLPGMGRAKYPTIGTKTRASNMSLR